MKTQQIKELEKLYYRYFDLEGLDDDPSEYVPLTKFESENKDIILFKSYNIFFLQFFRKFASPIYSKKELSIISFHSNLSFLEPKSSYDLACLKKKENPTFLYKDEINVFTLICLAFSVSKEKFFLLEELAQLEFELEESRLRLRNFQKTKNAKTVDINTLEISFNKTRVFLLEIFSLRNIFVEVFFRLENFVFFHFSIITIIYSIDYWMFRNLRVMHSFLDDYSSFVENPSIQKDNENSL